MSWTGSPVTGEWVCTRSPMQAIIVRDRPGKYAWWVYALGEYREPTLQRHGVAHAVDVAMVDAERAMQVLTVRHSVRGVSP